MPGLLNAAEVMPCVPLCLQDGGREGRAGHAGAAVRAP